MNKMNSSEIKELLISALDTSANPDEISSNLEMAGVSYDFSVGFSDAVLNKIFSARFLIDRELGYVKRMRFAFRSIAISGVAAIILLLISIFIAEGSISVNTFLGLRDNYDESIICLLTGK
jgi:hypothetical protein